LGPIGSAVLTFIGYKQTPKHPDKPNLYIDNVDDFNLALYIALKQHGCTKTLKQFKKLLL